jgi:hypothetical protein
MQVAFRRNQKPGNESTLDSVKEKIKLAKEFGQRSNFQKPIDGHFPSDEIESWEFTAIAAKLSNGIGVYRPVNDIQLKWDLRKPLKLLRTWNF